MRRPSNVPESIGSEPGTPWTPASFTSLIRGSIRQIWFRWPGRKLALKMAREEVPEPKKSGGVKYGVWYRCSECNVLGKEKLGKQDAADLKAWTEECKRAKKAGVAPLPRPNVPYRVWVDHKEPVVPVDGSDISWDEYIFRTFCPPEDLQILCTPCHKKKTYEENRERRENVKKIEME